MSSALQPYATPGSQAFNKALERVMPGGVHYNFRAGGDAPPVRLTSARGSRVTDIDGNEYLDLSAAFGTLVLGHGHAEFTQAIVDQASRLFQAVDSDLELRAVEVIQRWFPAAEMVRFGLSGSETVSNAVRLARAFTGRQKVLRFGGHYHGSADLMLGGKPPAEPGPPVGTPGDPFDTEGASEGVRNRECVMVPWNDTPRALLALDRFGQALAAVIMEPICVNGGGVAMQPEFARAVAERCRQQGILLIFDETITGVRAGPGGAQHRLGMTPDLFVAGKAISNGMPASILAGRAEIMQLLAQRRVVHGGTYNGYPLGLRAIITTLGILSRDGFAVLRKAEAAVDELARTAEGIAHEAGVPFHVNRHGTAAVLHPCLPPDDQRVAVEHYSSLSASLAAGTMAKALRQFGIMLCPVSRCYGTMALDGADIAMLAERFRMALAAAGSRIARLAAAGR